MRSLDKFIGCMAGGAAGDALGYPVEFMRSDEIVNTFGAAGVTEYILKNGVAEISDDTQMSLFTAAGLLLGMTRGILHGFSAEPSECIALCYKDWYRTQMTPYPIPKKERHSWLGNVKGLFRRRAPGMTCLSALQGDVMGTIERPLNDSKGCGGVMRVAPVGLFCCDTDIPIETSDRIAAEAAAITHGHPLGYIPAAMLAHMIRRIVEQGESMRDAALHALTAAEPYYQDDLHRERQTKLIELALSLAAAGGDDLNNIQAIGAGWVAEETLAIAVYCAVKYETDFARGITAAVSHGGDSDSTGAVAGNLLGARLGIGAIPEKFIKNLELYDVIKEIATDLFTCGTMEDAAFGSRTWQEKYVKFSYCPKGRK